MSNITRKCPHCKKVYFVIENEDVCPFCGYDENSNNLFKDIFGDDNPFSNMGVT
jgi:RNA polymerase subunit RPABC4/transcription elongation factor Spt4